MREFGLQIRGARDRQEDYFAVLPCAEGSNGTSVLILADGMGGHAGGHIAASAAVETCVNALNGGDATRDRLHEALLAANRAIAARIAEEPTLEGMGCTLIIAVVGRGALRWISVGDSHLYLCRRGSVKKLNEDHSMAPELQALADAGRLTRAEVAAHPMRNALRSVICGEDIELIDSPQDAIALEDGDLILLASDGLNTLDHLELSSHIGANSGQPSRDIVETLLSAVASRADPRQDNTTVVACRWTEGESIGDHSRRSMFKSLMSSIHLSRR